MSNVDKNDTTDGVNDNEQPIEEEEEYPDNTGMRDDIIDSQPKSYEELVNELNNLQLEAPEPLNIDTSSYEKIFQALPVIIDNAKCIYNTKTYRTEALLKEANELYNEYVNSHKDIILKYSIEQQQTPPKEMDDELKALMNDYLQKCLEITNRIDALNNETNTETGFIGDVYIEGKLNNHPISEYVLRSELDDYGHVDLTEYLKIVNLRSELIKQFPELSFIFTEMSAFEDKLQLKLDKDVFGVDDTKTLVSDILFYNKHCCSLNQQSDNIAVKLLPLVEDNQYYYIDGYLYVKNYWNSEVVYRISVHVLNKNVEVNKIEIIRSNGTNWTPLEGLHKITVGDKSYVGVVVNSTDSYTWDVYFTGYYHDVIVCGIFKNDEFVDDSVYEVIDDNALAKDINDKLNLKADKEHTHSKQDITDFEHEHTIKDITDLNIDTFATKEHTHLLTDITDLDIDTFADKQHKHTIEDITDFEHTHLSTDITDRISEYIEKYENETNKTVLQNETIFNGVDIVDGLNVSFNDNFTMTIKINEQDMTITNDDINKTYNIDILNINITSDKITLSSTVKITKDEIINVDDIIIDSVSKPNEIINIEYIPAKQPTDMKVDKLITAQAVEQYCDSVLDNITVDTSNLATKEELNEKANIEHTHTMSDITDLDLSTIDVDSLKPLYVKLDYTPSTNTDHTGGYWDNILLGRLDTEYKHLEINVMDHYSVNVYMIDALVLGANKKFSLKTYDKTTMSSIGEMLFQFGKAEHNTTHEMYLMLTIYGHIQDTFTITISGLHTDDETDKYFVLPDDDTEYSIQMLDEIDRQEFVIPRKEHKHTIEDITDLENITVDTSNLALKEHTHKMSDITDLNLENITVDVNKTNEYIYELKPTCEITQTDNLFRWEGTPIVTGVYVGQYVIYGPYEYDFETKTDYCATCIIHYKGKQFEVNEELITFDYPKEHIFEDLQLCIGHYTFYIALPLNYTEEIDLTFTNIVYKDKQYDDVSIKAKPAPPLTDLTSDSLTTVNYVNEFINKTKEDIQSQANKKYAAIAHYHSRNEIPDFAHTHTVEDITDLSSITGGPHTHTTADITDVVTEYVDDDLATYIKSTTLISFKALVQYMNSILPEYASHEGMTNLFNMLSDRIDELDQRVAALENK